jgi:hypothetical protein
MLHPRSLRAVIVSVNQTEALNFAARVSTRQPSH